MLLDGELALVNKLGECFNEWSSLEPHHPSDLGEFARGVHALQNMVMARSAARAHPAELCAYGLGVKKDDQLAKSTPDVPASS